MSIAELSAQREALRVLSQFWDLLSLEDQHLLEEHLSVCNYKKHEIIYSEGQRPDYLFCVINGNVKIYRDGVCGRSQIMRVLGRGDYFGWKACLRRNF